MFRRKTTPKQKPNWRMNWVSCAPNHSSPASFRVESEISPKTGGLQDTLRQIIIIKTVDLPLASQILGERGQNPIQSFHYVILCPPQKGALRSETPGVRHKLMQREVKTREFVGVHFHTHVRSPYRWTSLLKTAARKYGHCSPPGESHGYCNMRHREGCKSTTTYYSCIYGLIQWNEIRLFVFNAGQ